MAHDTHASLKQQGMRSHAEKRKHHMAGMHPDAKEDAKMISRAVHEHESHDHPGKPKTKLKFAHGGHVDGEHGKKRLDRASGGRTMHKGKAGTHVNVIVAPGAGGAGAPPMGMPRPPMPGAMPPGAPPMPPTGMLAGLGAPKPPMGPPVGAGVPMRARGGAAYKDGGGVKEHKKEHKKEHHKEHKSGKRQHRLDGGMINPTPMQPTTPGTINPTPMMPVNPGGGFGTGMGGGYGTGMGGGNSRPMDGNRGPGGAPPGGPMQGGAPRPTGWKKGGDVEKRHKKADGGATQHGASGTYASDPDNDACQFSEPIMKKEPMPDNKRHGGNIHRAHGGRAYPIHDGAGGGLGRLEKIKAYGDEADKKEGRKRGGRS